MGEIRLHGREARNSMMDADSNEDMLRAHLGKIARGSGLILSGILSFKALTFLKQFAIIHMLTPSDYGLYSLGMAVISVFMVFSGLGLYSGTQRNVAFFHAQGDEARVRGVMISTLRLVAVSTAFFTAVSMLLAKPLAQLFNKPDFAQVLILFAALIPLSLGIQTMSSFFLGFSRTSYHVFFENLGLSLASLFMVLLFLALRNTLFSALLAQVCAHSLIFLLGLGYTLKTLRFRLRGKDRMLMTRRLLLFSLPLMAASILTFLMMQTDTLMLGYYANADLMGFYNAAYLLSNMLAVFLNAVSTIFLPAASDLIARGHFDILRRLYRSATKWLFLFSLPLFLTFFLFPSQIIGLAFGGQYPTAARALQLLCLGDFIHTFLGPNGVTLIACGHSRIFLLVTAGAAGINVVLNALLIPHLGITGAAAASFTALICVNILTTGYLYRYYRIHPFSGDYIRYVLLVLVAAALLYYPFLLLAQRSAWYLLAFYPLLVGMSLMILRFGKSMDATDKALVAAAKVRLRGYVDVLRKHR